MKFPYFSLTFLVFKISLTNLQNSLTLKKNQISLTSGHLENMSRSTTKPNKWPLRPGKTQISLGIRPVWSESSLFTWRNTESLAQSEDSDQTGMMMPGLIKVYARPRGHFVVFVVLWLKLFCITFLITVSAKTLFIFCFLHNLRTKPISLADRH